MKTVCLLFLIVNLFGACRSSEKKQDNATPPTNDTIPTTAAPAKTDSAVVTTTAIPAPDSCQSLVAADKLNKPDTYQESAKPLTITLTLNQDSSQVTTPEKCYFNNTVTVQAVKKSGKPAFKRTLLKDDLLYFIKTDEAVIRSVLQNVIYKPTFNSQKYITLTMLFVDPTTQEKSDYTLFMNYFGEILKVR